MFFLFLKSDWLEVFLWSVGHLHLPVEFCLAKKSRAPQMDPGALFNSKKPKWKVLKEVANACFLFYRGLPIN